ncbi:hypothetical protein QUF54_02550 [Candidatus Marithioploca araucensis]|uniref:Uncharacterized protein n=1 Tax=Candidatus Marithioploca araucensis TaxID=70273 RepID=A0ABT7VSL0_9GAMM|nr:hypothetical protein [Candidatus Marithioploca araucensis]
MLKKPKRTLPTLHTFLMRKVGKKRTLPTLPGYLALPTLPGFFNEEGGQEKDFAHPTWLLSLKTSC